MLKTRITVLLIIAACSVTGTAAPVGLYFDRDVPQVEFAAHEITLAFKAIDQSMDLGDVSKLESTHFVREFIRNIPHKVSRSGQLTSER